MAAEVVMPRLGWNMEEGAVAAWRKNSGDAVTAGEILFEVESDKATQEVEATESGILHIPRGSPAVGAQVPVGTLLAWLLRPGEAAPAAAPDSAAAPDGAAAPAPARAPTAAAAPPAVARGAAVRPAPPRPRPRGHRVAISPRARRVAGELDVEWTALRGSGSTGRIVERDVREAAAHGASRGAGVSAHGRCTAILATLSTEADATELVRLRKQLGPGLTLSTTDIVLRVAVQALSEHRGMNSRVEGDVVVRPAEVNIALALDSQSGIVAPVIHDAASKHLRELAGESADLAGRARDGKLRPEEISGASFAVMDLGGHDVDAFTPIMPRPDCAALGIGRITARQVVTDAQAGTVSIRWMVVLSLSFDHRIADTLTAARFLRTLKGYVENPYLCLAAQ